MYVSLPDAHEGSLVYCIAYAFVFPDYDQANSSDFLMFTIERSISGTTCIAIMNDGERANLCEATGTIEGDMKVNAGLIADDGKK